MTDDQLALQWYDAWNARDADAIVNLYAEEFEFSSPFVAALGFGAEGVITLKPMLRAYVDMVLSRVPDLSFESIAVCQGCHGHILVYRNQSGVMVAESHDYDASGRIIRASTAYEINPKGG
jgi:hypothetical protein